ncbi:hypothetical protein TrST_g1382 [Triparma strigata]|uniref:Uncharacterized protein n=1 Tax=Triparma strigata TaxID=1606541 RepID=A0A9W7AM42_9STRA|nr:hypothetical protein TrST_g1382 [Triparma strigata]
MSWNANKNPDKIRAKLARAQTKLESEGVEIGGNANRNLSSQSQSRWGTKSSSYSSRPSTTSGFTKRGVFSRQGGNRGGSSGGYGLGGGSNYLTQQQHASRPSSSSSAIVQRRRGMGSAGGGARERQSFLSSSMPVPTLSRSYSEGGGGRGVSGMRNLARGALRPKMRVRDGGGRGVEEDLWGDNDCDTDPNVDDGDDTGVTTGFEPSARRKRSINVAAASNKSYTWKTKLISCGSNHSCQLGYPQKGGKKAPLPQEPFSTQLKEVGLNGAECSHVTSVAVGGSVTFITNVNNEVWAWGSGPLGGGGSGGSGGDRGGYASGVTKSMAAVSTAWNGVSASPRKLPFGVNISSVSSGPAHAIAVSINGEAFTWGNGADGRLGHGDDHNRATPTKLELTGGGCVFNASCGERHTMIVVDESGRGVGYVPPSGSEEAKELKGVRTGTLMSFGSNKGGQLGTGDIVNRMSPSVVTCSAWRRGAMVTEVSCGMHHTLALAVVGNSHPVKRRVYAWGWGEHGRLGVGHEEMQLSPTEVALMSHRNVLSVKAGEQHSIAMTENGDVYSWGSNRFGQLGVSLDGDTLPSNPLPQKVVMEGGELAEFIDTGSRHSSVVTKSGRVLLWGWGEEGQLGNMAERNSDAPSIVDVPDVIGEAGKVGKVVGIGLGLSHTVILVENVKKVSAEYLQEEVKVVEKVKEEVVQRRDLAKEAEAERRQKQKDFAKKMMEQAKQAEIEFEAKEARALQQQKALAQRRKSEASTLAKFEERKAGMKKKEEVVVKKPVQVVLEKREEEEHVEEPVMVLEEMKSNDSDSMTTTSRESIETSDDSRKENIILARPKSPNNVQFAQKFKYDQIYYHPDQPVEKCFVANAARRAMMRSISRKKAEGKKRFEKRMLDKKKAKMGGGGGGGGGGGEGGIQRTASSSILRRSSYT